MLREQVRDHIRGLADQELVRYVQAGTRIYEADAVAFAQREFQRRKLDPRQLVELEGAAELPLATHADEGAEATTRPLGLGYATPPTEPNATDAEDPATRPLDGYGKALAFMAGCFGPAALVLVFPIWLRMDLRGEHGRSKDLKRCFLWGLLVSLFLYLILIAERLYVVL